jgi:transcriptional regulator with XRE-family HTH domain
METQLKAARRARGWSQMRLLSELQRVAKFRGVAVPSRASLKTEISRWENGHVTPTEPYVGLLAEAYQLSPAELGLTVAVPESFPGGPSGSGIQAPAACLPSPWR